MDPKDFIKTPEFAEFRAQVLDLGQDDNVLLRFLKARNFNTAQAEEMLRKTIQWRKDNDIDNALTWKLAEDVTQRIAGECSGMDFNNNIVAYTPQGTWNTRIFVEAGREDELCRAVYQLLERAAEEGKNRDADQMLFIIDFKGLSFWQVAHYPTLQVSLKLFRESEQNYPECLSEVLIINAPRAFHWGWPIFKPVFTGSTLSKIQVFGSDESKYIPELLKRMPESSLPSALKERAILLSK